MLIRKIRDELFAQKKQENPLIGIITPTLLKNSDIDAQSPYVNEADISAATIRLIDSARESVILQAYKFMADKQSSVRLIEALKNLREKAARNCQKINVYILLNRRVGLAAIATGKYGTAEYADQLAPLRALAHKDNEYFNLHCCYHEHQSLASFHTKFIIIDGTKMMLRGCDFGENERLETCAIMENQEMINGVIRHFCEAWNSTDSEKIQAEKFSPKNVTQNQAAMPNPNAVLLCKREFARPFSSYWSPVKIAMIQAVRNAERSIHIIIPNLNDSDIINELIAAAWRGIDIKIYMGKLHNQFLETIWGGNNIASMRAFHDACSHFAKQPDIRWATYQGRLVVNKNVYEMHGKAVIIDERYVLTGSSALDKQALLNSRETDIIFDLPDIAQRYEGFFQNKFEAGMPFMSVQQHVVSEIDDELDQLNSIQVYLVKTAGEKYKALEILRERMMTPESVGSRVRDIVNDWLKENIAKSFFAGKKNGGQLIEHHALRSSSDERHSQIRFFIDGIIQKYGSLKLCDKVNEHLAQTNNCPANFNR